MATSYERNIIQLREDYTNHLVDIITPLIYEGLHQIYNYSKEAHAKLKEEGKVENGMLKIFQNLLQRIPSWNQQMIERETVRIRQSSKCEDWFDDLIKAVVKSHIVLLTNS